ncbi:hypothetical protein MPER_01042 [Moniliophthora perniciosa FA553]|nr:hypothetical protein MPER_01042 [Moniliophthora perniciosa FA553]
MKTFPEMTKLHNNPQLQNFMFIHRQYSPDAPKRPGGGGLFLDAEDDPNTPDISIEINEKECDWVVVTQNGPNKWRLIGLAAVKGLPCLTAEEWKELGSEVRVSYIVRIASDVPSVGQLGHIYTRKWGNRFKARILLRQMEQEEPTRERVKDDLKEKRLPLHTVTKEQIEQAFNVGLIRFPGFGLPCISYPEEILRQIINEMTFQPLNEPSETLGFRDITIA